MSKTTLLLGDNLNLLPTIASESAELAITSPPYKTVDGYDPAALAEVFKHLHRILKPGSLFFLNFGHLANAKFRPFTVCALAMVAGFKLNETITWVKNHYKPIQGSRRLNNLSEFIFVLYKGKMPKLNRLAIGVPYVDKTNAKRFAGGRDLKCAGNVWYINYETITRSEQKLHHDRFPVDLPKRCIKICGYPVQTVIDPYSGGGTTGEAAKALGKDFIGMEIQPANFNVAHTRLGI